VEGNDSKRMILDPECPYKLRLLASFRAAQSVDPTRECGTSLGVDSSPRYGTLIVFCVFWKATSHPYPATPRPQQTFHKVNVACHGHSPPSPTLTPPTRGKCDGHERMLRNHRCRDSWMWPDWNSSQCTSRNFWYP
jgi:hypothetical protein